MGWSPLLSIMSLIAVNRLIAGALIMAYLVIGLFFLRFWKRTHDRLFVIFAVAFWVLAINRLLATAVSEDQEIRGLTYYIVRLIAFLLILAAIIDKNRSTRTRQMPRSES